MTQMRCVRAAGVCQQVGHAASRQGGTSHGGEGTQMWPVSQDVSVVAAADAALAGPQQRAQVRVRLLRQSVQATVARPAASADSYRSVHALLMFSFS